ncbi:Toxin YoeB [Ferriphaselus amnicola]|uniref:Putative mRNA interferase YoeB n=2 Tax=Ferriphaselus amnicola TaxID=1188319 RepID=A0A2Z6GE64_9PROT|nr:Txe/YoeB family addiction module toxin [Ferriphaselus amnicola]BBE51574.1 Toxin YoeB [Ferriphaselus amnicola]
MPRLLTFTPSAWGDYLYWQGQDKKTLRRINALLNDTLREPFGGIGKPEPLRGDLSGLWSKRIDDTNRLVYQVTDTELVVIACLFHYDG